ncbi:hypothetical protein [Actinophytocola sp.]|uniref:hypothetical protein n=1 Tax=Actinophytocola sp. TaxID=1872138 RepID=UPI00389A1DC1
MRKRLSVPVVLLVLLTAVAPSAAAAPGVRTAPAHTAAVRTGFAPPSGQARPNAIPPGYSFWNLQLNLCNSGVAGCFDGGKSVPEAQQVITNWAPDVVTLNEVCLPDVRDQLFPTMSQTWAGDWVFWAFMPAWNAGQNAPYQCANGRGEYGNGIIGHVPAANWAGVDARGGIYQSQDANTNEWRSWVCTYAVGNYYGCGTHLASGNATAANLQCNDLLRNLVPAFRSAEGGYHPTVVGGDFNLKYKGNPDIQACVPSGWYRKGDGDVQHWFVTADLTFDFTREIGMSHTDHPGWLVATTTS